jgi:flavin reductase (DIM6/NTAB) family NADH-FMN oxidoreductase RutF
MFYDTSRNNHGLPRDPFKALVAPRPIGWISSVSGDGIANLAPYSFFNAVATDPYYVVFGSGPRKDTLRNIEATGEFAVNIATYDLRLEMNASSATVAADVDEFELAGLGKASCRLISSPRVAESPACLECRLHRVVDLPDESGRANDFLVIGKVVGIYIDDRFIVEGRVDTAAMRPIARLGYNDYATVESAWPMRRPP